MKPCPFCGSARLNITHSDSGLSAVECVHCGAAGPLDDEDAPATERWDRRTADTALHTEAARLCMLIEFAQRHVASLHAKNTALHRRAQQAEAAVAAAVKRWDSAGGPRGGTFGRALLACEVERLRAEVAQLRAAQSPPD
jgi:Lar family restriction alleviation protein